MFKENFVRICNQKNIAPSVVCQNIGLSSATYSKWNDSSVPRKATLMKLADYLGVTEEELLYGSLESEDDETKALKKQLINIINSETDLDRLEMIDKLIEATAEKRRKAGE